MKGVFVERLTYANSKQDISVIAENVPPIISPSLRADRVFNTEMEKKSVYLEGKFFEKDHINGKNIVCLHAMPFTPFFFHEKCFSCDYTLIKIKTSGK